MFQFMERFSLDVYYGGFLIGIADVPNIRNPHRVDVSGHQNPIVHSCLLVVATGTEN